MTVVGQTSSLVGGSDSTCLSLMHSAQSQSAQSHSAHSHSVQYQINLILIDGLNSMRINMVYVSPNPKSGVEDSRKNYLAVFSLSVRSIVMPENTLDTLGYNFLAARMYLT